MNIGTRIRELRERNKLSQEKFGELCGASKGSVSQWETGISSPPTDRLLMLKKNLEFSLDWLIAGEVDNNFALTRPSIQKLIEVAQPLPDNAVAALTREGGVYAELISETGFRLPNKVAKSFRFKFNSSFFKRSPKPSTAHLAGLTSIQPSPPFGCHPLRMRNARQ